MEIRTAVPPTKKAPEASPRRFVPPPTRRQIQALKALQREEENARLATESWEAASFAVLGIRDQGLEMEKIEGRLKHNTSSLNRLEEASYINTQSMELSLALSKQLLQISTTSATTLKLFVDYHSSEVRDNCRRLETENITLRQSLGTKELENTRLFAEVDNLRDALSRVIIRSDLENERLERIVRLRAEETRLDTENIKQELLKHVDIVVNAIYPTKSFAPALADLKLIVDDRQQEIDRSMGDLRSIIDSLTVTSRFDVGDQLHSNFPIFYREQLATLTQEQLLRILDQVSFEPRVVGCVGKAIFEMKAKHVL